jgi:drug/metabolite transporter (DMT)-like permease
MSVSHLKKDQILGISLAVLATMIWAGNFVISKGVSQLIGPISLAFFRWTFASLIIIPIAWPSYKREKQHIKENIRYLFWVSLSGITLFNTCIYVSGHFTTAINMALIGTTSSPIFATIFAIIFLKEKINATRLAGLIMCIIGILILLSKGSFEKLWSLRFGVGDLWILAAGFCFAIYSVLVKKKPSSISSLHFLMLIFSMGAMMLFPFFLIENWYFSKPQFTPALIGSILYLGFGTSVVAFLCWNIALQKLGTSRTVLFGNLTPIFSTLEAVLILGEKFSSIHIISGLMVIGGLVIANISTFNPIKKNPYTEISK